MSNFAIKSVENVEKSIVKIKIC